MAAISSELVNCSPVGHFKISPDSSPEKQIDVSFSLVWLLTSVLLDAKATLIACAGFLGSLFYPSRSDTQLYHGMGNGWDTNVVISLTGIDSDALSC